MVSSVDSEAALSNPTLQIRMEGGDIYESEYLDYLLPQCLYYHADLKVEIRNKRK